MGSFSLGGKNGANMFTFRGRVAGRTLAAGSYRFTVVAADGAKNDSKTATLAFKILKR